MFPFAAQRSQASPMRRHHRRPYFLPTSSTARIATSFSLDIRVNDKWKASSNPASPPLPPPSSEAIFLRPLAALPTPTSPHSFKPILISSPIPLSPPRPSLIPQRSTPRPRNYIRTFNLMNTATSPTGVFSPAGKDINNNKTHHQTRLQFQHQGQTLRHPRRLPQSRVATFRPQRRRYPRVPG